MVILGQSYAQQGKKKPPRSLYSTLRPRFIPFFSPHPAYTHPLTYLSPHGLSGSLNSSLVHA